MTALGQYYIAPGQAFFVAASGSANVSFDTDMQSTAGTDDFLPGKEDLMMIHLLKMPLALTLRSLLLLVLMTLNTQLLIFI